MIGDLLIEWEGRAGPEAVAVGAGGSEERKKKRKKRIHHTFREAL